MVLLKDEYTEMENSFLELYSDEIKRIVYAEKKVYMDERMKDMKLTEFIKRYMGSVAFILIILFFAWVKDVVSIHILVGFAILQFIAFLPAYEAWKKDITINEEEWNHIQDIVMAAGELDKKAPYGKLIYTKYFDEFK